MSETQLQQTQHDQQQIRTNQADAGLRMEPGMFRNLSAAEQPGTEIHSEEFQHIVPVEAARQNELLTHRLLQGQRQEIRPLQATREEVAGDYKPKKESIKEKRERKRQKEEAVKANCFRQTANAGYLHQIANGQNQDAALASGERNGEPMQELKKNLLGFPIDTRVFMVSRLSMSYVRGSLPGILAMRDRAAIMREKLDGNEEGVWDSPAEKAQIEDQIKIFDAFFDQFRLLAADYGVDIKTGEYLRKPLEEDPNEMSKRSKVIAHYILRREEVRKESMAEKEKLSRDEEIVKNLTETERETYGSCSYHKYMSRKEAEEVVNSGGGYLYAQQAGEDVYEVRATLPEEVRIGEKTVPLRKTYNQLIKAMLRPMVDKDGKSFRSTKDNIDFKVVNDKGEKTSLAGDYLTELNDALYTGDVEKLKNLLGPGMAGTRKVKEEFFRNLSIIYATDSPFFSGEVGNSFAAFFDKLTASKEAQGNLADRLEAIEKSGLSDEDKAIAMLTAGKFHIQANEAEQELLGLLKIDDNEIDVPLPGQCSGNAQFILRMKKDIAMANARAEARKEGREDTDEARKEAISDELNKDFYQFDVEKHGMKAHPIYQIKCYLEERERSKGSDFSEIPGMLKVSLEQMIKLGFVRDETDQDNKTNQVIIQEWIKELAAGKKETGEKREEHQEKPIKDAGQLAKEQAAAEAAKKTREKREEALSKALENFRKVYRDENYLKKVQIDNFELDEGDKNSFSSMVKHSKAVTYDYHQAVALGKTKDGRAVVSECFAPEAVEYTKSPFTREHKAIGIYINGKQGFTGSYSQDKLVVDPRESKIIGYNARIGNVRPGDKIYFPGEDLLDAQKASQQNTAG